MSVPDDCLLLLYGSDGEQWANFIASRLNSPQYNIKSILRNIAQTTDDSKNALQGQNSTTSPNITDNIGSTRNNGYNLDSPKVAQEQRDSGRGSGSTIHEFSTTFGCITNTRGSVVFLSPDSISVCSFQFDVSSLNPRRTVFLFLGVDIEEVRTLFGDKSDSVFKCRCCVIGADEASVCDAMVQIIEAYEHAGGNGVLDEEDEDDNDIYSSPGCPRQLNRIERVFPRELTETDRDVYILLERTAEDDVSALIDGALSRKTQLICVCERLYKLTIPKETSGEIFFKVECQGHCIGAESVQILSRLDRLKAILKQEVSPLSILASAAGLTSDDLGGLDTALAFKLQQFAPALTFQRMFPCEDALINSLRDERANVLYPSLLHFAADLNLRAFCSELLRYPGMLAAALTENSDGEYPSQIAARKGHAHLESDLVNFVERHSTTRYRRPKPHLSTSTSPEYMNQQRAASSASGLYIDMFNLSIGTRTSLDQESQPLDEELISPLSVSSENVFRLSNDGDGDSAEKEEVFLRLQPEHETSSLGSTSSKALRMLGVREEDIASPRSSTISSATNRSESPICKPFIGSMSPGVQGFGVNQILADPTRTPSRTASENSCLKGTPPSDSKLKTLTKIVSFFSKIKTRRLNSEGETIAVSSRGLKKSLSNKSDKSFKSIQEVDLGSPLKKFPEGETPERDSGSYSDEDKDKTFFSSDQKNGRSKEFKDRGRPVTRRLSQRAQAASKECVRGAPELPSASLRTEIFQVE